MRISAAFPSDYLKAADLMDRNVKVVISGVEMRDIGDDHKPVLFFQGKDRGLVLNKTNSNNIAIAYGDETDDWVGKEIILYPAMVDFQGRSVQAIRVRAPALKDRQQPRPQLKTVESEDPGSAPALKRASVDPAMDDDIPFAPEMRG